MGAVHSAKLPYQFPRFSNTDKLDGPALAPPARALGETMMQVWTSFTATGTPGAAGAADWPAFKSAGDVMRLEPGDVRLFDASTEHHCDFWRKLHPGLLGG